MRGIFLFLGGVVSLFSQTSGVITGAVYDPSAEPVSGAGVSATLVETGLERTTRTDDDGRYVLPLLPPGSYRLRAAAENLQPAVRSGLALSVAETLRVDFHLQLGPVETEITVTGEPPLVNTETSELSYLVEESVIRELPLNGRNYTDLALLQPGVVAFPNRDGGSIVAHGLGFSVNGQDPRSNVYLIDGTPQNDFTNGPAGSAASTVLGTETIREFRVEANSYSAEFGRNFGGQITALTKSGGNEFHGSAFYFHRNDNLDARNFFDLEAPPEFRRNQYGGTLGGPIAGNRTFFFAGYEGLREDKGRTISTVTPNAAVRLGPVNPAVKPYLDEFPLPNGRELGGGLAEYVFFFNEEIRQDFLQGRIDHLFSAGHQFFTRYTIDDARQDLATDFPQFPRSFLSRNQFLTTQLSSVFSPRTLNTFRAGFSRTNVGQDVESNTAGALAPFVPGRDKPGNIDIGGMPRFGPQTSVNVNLVQNVFSVEDGLTLVRGAHTIKTGGLVERYQDNMVNPTFSLGIHSFSNLQTFLAGQSLRFIGLTPEGQWDRYWRFTLLAGYLQDDWKVAPRLTLNLGLRYEFATMPRDIYGRDSTLLRLSDTEPFVGQLYENPTGRNFSPRVGFSWDVRGDGRLAVRGGYGWFFNTNNQQNLIVTVTNPPVTPRVVLARPSFPQPDFSTLGGVSMRPVEWNLKNPNLHVWNLNLQQRLPHAILLTVGYAGSRGVHLLRNGDANTATPERQPDGTWVYPQNGRRPNPAFSAIELKSSDGNSWYNALLVEVRRRFDRGLSFQSSYTLSRTIDTTQASTFFSDSQNGTTSIFPEPPGLNYNKGLADFHAKHNWVVNFVWQIPFAKNAGGAAGAVLGGWELAAISSVRSGQPLTVFVQQNRSRSLWAPSLAPGMGFDRPSMAPGYTHATAVIGRPDRWFDPGAFALQPAGTLGNSGRGAIVGPNLRIFNLALLKNFSPTRRAEALNIQFRAEFFNLFNRPNFGPPSLQAFAGVRNGEAPLSSFGRVRTTVTEARQIQLGLRISF